MLKADEKATLRRQLKSFYSSDESCAGFPRGPGLFSGWAGSLGYCLSLLRSDRTEQLRQGSFESRNFFLTVLETGR